MICTCPQCGAPSEPVLLGYPEGDARRMVAGLCDRCVERKEESGIDDGWGDASAPENESEV